MNTILSLFIYGVVEFLIESFGWGVMGYLLFRSLGVKEKYWYLDYILVVVIFIMWDIWSNAFMIKLDISIGNEEVLALLDYDIKGLFEFYFLDFIIDAVQILLGYMIGYFLLKKLRKLT